MSIHISFLLLLLVVAEISFDEEPSDEGEAQFDEILSLVIKIYNFIKYPVLVFRVMMLVFAGVSYLISGGEQSKKEKEKKKLSCWQRR